MTNRRRPTLAVCIGMALTLVGFLAACGGSDAAEEATFAGYEREPEPTVGAASLPAVNRGGADFAFRADDGGLLIVYFGYTSCPDVCPTTMADARLALNTLGERADDVDFAFVTIDPNRDTDDVTTSYVEAFVDDGIALRTEDPDALAIAADAFGVTYSVVENEDGEIEVGHSPHAYVVDDTGSVVLTWPFGVSAEDIANDLTILLDRRART